METLFDMGQALVQIRDAADTLEVKGAKNAALVSLIYEKSNEIINLINDIARSYEDKNQNGTKQSNE